MGPDPIENAHARPEGARIYGNTGFIYFRRMLEMLDTIVLDLGGVLIDVDYERAARAFTSHGVSDFDALYSKAKQSDLFDRFETGELDAAGFRTELRRSIGIDLADAQIDHCWNAMLGEVPAERIEMLGQLRERYTLLLLSNTNSIHVPAFMKIIVEKNGIDDFRSLFDGAYFSNELGLRKPNPEIFIEVLRRHGSIPERSLFIDDSPQHVEGARQAGLHAMHLDLAKEDIVQMVDRIKLLDRPAKGSHLI